MGRPQAGPLPAPGPAWLLYVLFFCFSQTLFIQSCRTVSIFHHPYFSFLFPRKLTLVAMASVFIFSSYLDFLRRPFHPRCWKFGKHVSCLFSLALCSFCGMSSRKCTFEFLPCTSLALRLFKEGEKTCYPFLSHDPSSSPLLTVPTLPTALEFASSWWAPGSCSIPRRRLLGCQRL